MANLPHNIRKVWGPQESEGKWRMVVETASGRRTSRAYKTKENAQRAIDRVKSKIAEGVVQVTNIPDFDGTIGWFFRVVGLLTHELAVTRNKELRQDLKAIAQAGLSAKNLYDTTKLEVEVFSLRDEVKAILQEDEYVSEFERPRPRAERISKEETQIN